MCRASLFQDNNCAPAVAPKERKQAQEVIIRFAQDFQTLLKQKRALCKDHKREGHKSEEVEIFTTHSTKLRCLRMEFGNEQRMLVNCSSFGGQFPIEIDYRIMSQRFEKVSLSSRLKNPENLIKSGSDVQMMKDSAPCDNIKRAVFLAQIFRIVGFEMNPVGNSFLGDIFSRDF